MHGSERNQIKRQPWDWGIFFAWIILAKGVNKNASYVYNVDKYTYRLWSLNTMMIHDQQLNNIQKKKTKTCNFKVQKWNTSQNTLQTSTLLFPENNESHRLRVVLGTLPCYHLNWNKIGKLRWNFQGLGKVPKGSRFQINWTKRDSLKDYQHRMNWVEANQRTVGVLSTICILTMLTLKGKNAFRSRNPFLWGLSLCMEMENAPIHKETLKKKRQQCWMQRKHHPLYPSPTWFTDTQFPSFPIQFPLSVVIHWLTFIRMTLHSH